MSTIYANDQETLSFVRKFAPKGFEKRKEIDVKPTDSVSIQGTYWSSGSRSTYVVVNMATGESELLNEGHEGQTVKLPPNGCVIEYSYSLSRRWIHVYVHPDNVQKFVAESDNDLTLIDKYVLFYTRSLKSTYNGIKNYRFVECNRDTGTTADEWEASKSKLIGMKLLNKAGAITTAGRNAAPSCHYWKDIK